MIDATFGEGEAPTSPATAPMLPRRHSASPSSLALSTSSLGVSTSPQAFHVTTCSKSKPPLSL
ncbi:hypothetical protein K523DRAFT_319196, partial [Schizophyllum commune Tattone D]